MIDRQGEIRDRRTDCEVVKLVRRCRLKELGEIIFHVQ